jgi:hypothetical protein
MHSWKLRIANWHGWCVDVGAGVVVVTAVLLGRGVLVPDTTVLVGGTLVVVGGAGVLVVIWQ